MRLYEETNGILNIAQSTVLPGVVARFRHGKVSRSLARDLLAEVAAALATDVAIYTKSGDRWTLLLSAGDVPTDDVSKFGSTLNSVPIATPVVYPFDGRTWTLITATEGEAHTALAAP